MPAIVAGALALAIIASIDTLLCARLASQPGEIRNDGDRLLVRLGAASAVAGAFGGITNGINIGPSVSNREFGGRTWVSVIVNALMLLAAATVLFPLVTYMPRAVLSAAIMVIAVQHIDPWSKQAAAQLFDRATPRRGVVALDLAVALFVSVLSIAVHVVLAVFIGIALAVFLFVLRMSRSNVRRIYRCDLVRSRKSRGPAEMAALEAKGSAILVIELQGALFFGSAERLAQVIARETASGTGAVLLDLRRVTDVDSTGARILGDIDQSLARQNIRLGLVYGGRGAAPGLAGVFNARDRIFPDIDRAIEWAEDGLRLRMRSASSGCRSCATSRRTSSRRCSVTSSASPGRRVRSSSVRAIRVRRCFSLPKAAPACISATSTGRSGLLRLFPARCSASLRSLIRVRAPPPSPQTRKCPRSLSAMMRSLRCASASPRWRSSFYRPWGAS
jgi:SulP family sulfate permease